MPLPIPKIFLFDISRKKAFWWSTPDINVCKHHYWHLRSFNVTEWTLYPLISGKCLSPSSWTSTQTSTSAPVSLQSKGVGPQWPVQCIMGRPTVWRSCCLIHIQPVTDVKINSQHQSAVDAAKRITKYSNYSNFSMFRIISLLFWVCCQYQCPSTPAGPLY